MIGPVDPLITCPLLHCCKVGSLVQEEVIWDPTLVNQILRELSDSGIGIGSISILGIHVNPSKDESLPSLG